MNKINMPTGSSTGFYRASDASKGQNTQEELRDSRHDLPSIKVNGQEIGSEKIAAEAQYHPAMDFTMAAQKAGQALVIQHLLKEQISHREIKEKGEEQAVSDLIERNIIESPITAEDTTRYYEQNEEKFKTAPLMEASHILLAAGRNDTGLRVKQKFLAMKLVGQLRENIDLFPSLVEEYSDCPSKKTAGSLGQLSKGQTVPEFERQLFPLPEGLHNKAIESRYGYHIVFVNKKIEGKQLAFSMVEDKINNYLVHRRHRQAVSDYLYKLADNASVEGIKLRLEQDNIVIGQ